jgi:cell division protein FtsW (lipid II flippase)
MEIACALSATLLGLLYLHAAGAPTTYLIVNALSLVMGLTLFAAIRQSANGSRTAGGVVLALGVILLATAIFGVPVEGASRWVRVGGVSLQISLIVLPGMLVLFARSSGILATTGIALAALGLGLQPDRAMAGIMAAALAVLALYRQERQVVLALTVAVVGFAVTLLRPDSLPAVPYVDQILYSSFEVHPLAGIAVLGGALLLIVPALAGFWRDPTNMAAHAVFGVAWLGMVVAAALGNYPTPVVGYGGSAILGYALSLSFMPIKARSTATAKARSEDPARTGTPGSADLRVRMELGLRSTQILYPSGA